MSSKPPEYEKFKDDAIRSRELDTAIGRVRTALFVAFLGPIGAVLIHYFKLNVPREAKFVVVATAPVALVLLLINYARIPGAGKASKQALSILFLTLGAIATTLFLVPYFKLL